MKKIFFISSMLIAFVFTAKAQADIEATNPEFKKEKAARDQAKANEDRKNDTNFVAIKTIAATPVKNQNITGTCWSFSTTSLVESQCLAQNIGELDLSEMFVVRNAYIEKAKNYVLRQGHAQFSEGGLGHDLINTIAKYGAMPENAYSGLLFGNSQHNHTALLVNLKTFLDSYISGKVKADNWLTVYKTILDSALGTPPEKFSYNGKQYTAKTFADEVLKFNANDYVYITSFTHHPYYEPFIVEIPDNFSNGAYYNLPLNEMLQLTKDALNSGYSIMWDADVSNEGFQQKMGAAANFNNLPAGAGKKGDLITGEGKEGKWDAVIRQELFENLTTQDDHLMHIVGLEKSKSGKTFFRVKNSWGDVGPKHGYINVSEGYFAINTITLVVPKAALNKKLMEKLKIN